MLFCGVGINLKKDFNLRVTQIVFYPLNSFIHVLIRSDVHQRQTIEKQQQIRITYATSFTIYTCHFVEVLTSFRILAKYK